jgi:hypothetical protein
MAQLTQADSYILKNKKPDPTLLIQEKLISNKKTQIGRGVEKKAN